MRFGSPHTHTTRALYPRDRAHTVTKGQTSDKINIYCYQIYFHVLLDWVDLASVVRYSFAVARNGLAREAAGLAKEASLSSNNVGTSVTVVHVCIHGPPIQFDCFPGLHTNNKHCLL